MRITALSAALLIGLAACGDGDQTADQPPPATQDTAADAPAPSLQDADWLQVDESAQTVTIDLVAGSTSANQHWNFNGLYGGEGLITVPQGYTVTINLTNEDPNMGHSVGVGEAQQNYPANFASPSPAFQGAITSNPTSMTDSTMPGESESITFTADRAGDFALICYVTGHAATGMYIPFVVSDDGSHGFAR